MTQSLLCSIAIIRLLIVTPIVDACIMYEKGANHFLHVLVMDARIGHSADILEWSPNGWL